MRHIKWPSIEQFRNVVKNVQHRASYVGMDDNGNAIYNNLQPKPTLKFEGTVKLHGTNSSVVISPICKFWAQSRENIITPEKDNAGFALFAHANEKIFQDIATFAVTIASFPIVPRYKGISTQDFVIFGEWCGKGIQKGVAISELPKMFVIFGMAFVDAEGQKTYLTREEISKSLIGYTGTETQIYSIYDFPTWNLDIDFENPHESQNKLNEITMKVEAECPVGKSFGVSGVGEGVVWRCISPGYEDSGYWFKVKGEAHSKSKVKTLAIVDIERINNIKELAERLANNGRLEQGYQLVFDTLNGGEPDITKMGEFIKWTMQDIFKEDLDVIVESGFNGKEINGPVSKIVREFLLKKLEV